VWQWQCCGAALYHKGLQSFFLFLAPSRPSCTRVYAYPHAHSLHSLRARTHTHTHTHTHTRTVLCDVQESFGVKSYLGKIELYLEFQKKNFKSKER
jgi:hypothetical protein